MNSDIECFNNMIMFQFDLIRKIKENFTDDNYEHFLTKYTDFLFEFIFNNFFNSKIQRKVSRATGLKIY